MKYLIDPPSPFDTLKVWEDFLAEMQKIENPDEDVRRHIEIAEREIRNRQTLNE